MSQQEMSSQDRYAVSLYEDYCKRNGKLPDDKTRLLWINEYRKLDWLKRHRAKPEKSHIPKGFREKSGKSNQVEAKQPQQEQPFRSYGMSRQER